MVVVNISFFAWDNYVSKAIRYMTNSDWSHCGVILKKQGNDVLIYEAVAKGFVGPDNWYGSDKLNSLRKDKVYDQLSVILPCTQERFEEVVKSYEGKKYDWKALIRIFLYLILGNFYVDKSKSAREVICSEAVSRVLYECSNGKIDLPDYYALPDHDFVTPENMYHYLRYIYKN